MKFLIDLSPSKVQRKLTMHPDLVCGQLCTPLTNYKNWNQTFAIDNGAYSGLDRNAFFRCLKKHEPHKENCLFVAVPDIVGNHRRTDDLYYFMTQDERMHPWNEQWCYVAQDGIEDSRIDWYAIKRLFIGGTDKFKDSSAAHDVVKCAKAMGIFVHVGRINSVKRFRQYDELGADTCDGSGVCKYDWMLEKISVELGRKPAPTLFDGEEEREYPQDYDPRKMPS